MATAQTRTGARVGEGQECPDRPQQRGSQMKTAPSGRRASVDRHLLRWLGRHPFSVFPVMPLILFWVTTAPEVWLSGGGPTYLIVLGAGTTVKPDQEDSQ